MIKYATLVGCAIGDALGNAFEMKAPSYQPLVEWDGTFKEGGTFWWGQPGQYTDDTLMSLALAKSMVKCGRFDPADVAQNYLDWYLSGNTRGIGNTTANAMHNLQHGATWEDSGLTGDHIGGNGTAMRVAPIGIVYRHDLFACLDAASNDAKITHCSKEPIMGSMAVALGIATLTNGSKPATALAASMAVTSTSVVGKKLQLVIEHLEKGTEPSKALLDIGAKGYVPETVGAAFYCLCANDNFKDTVIMAVKAGGDTDTTAAVAGALAGTYYGLDGIPEEYKSVEDFELLCSLDEGLANIKI